MPRKKRRKNLDRVTDFINDATVKVYTKNGLAGEFTLAVNAKEAVGILSVSKDSAINDVYFAALFTVLRDAMQDRVMQDIGRAGDFVQRVTANDADQLELTDDEGRSIKGFDLNDAPPF